MTTYVFPGQGSQFAGMGQALFPKFPKLVQEANDILGYSIEELCLKNPEGRLNQTQFTQPALYVVNALSYLDSLDKFGKPNFLAGHSLGEYNALLAAEAFDFSTGLRLVQKRGQLMSEAVGGGMMAVLRTPQSQLQQVLENHNLNGISIANFNSHAQIVIAGPKDELSLAEQIFFQEKIRCTMLNVSAAFHSQFMQPSMKKFNEFLQDFTFSSLKTPVISNVTAKPYQQHELHKNLGKQICSNVKWYESILYLLEMGESVFHEIGPKNVLKKIIAQIQKEMFATQEQLAA